MSTPCCFDTGQAGADPPAPPVRLKDGHGEALSRLLEMLLCGEESAALVFRGLGDAMLDRQLQRIGADELRHERLLQSLRQALPSLPHDETFQRKARRFFRTMECRDIGLHFASIAALDSGICRILGELLRRRRPLGDDAACSDTLGRIQADEARHVLVSLGFAKARTDRAARLERILLVRARLIGLLSERADEFERLHVDPQSLFVSLANVPHALVS